MARNIVLALSALAVLFVLFVGMWSFLDGPARDTQRRREAAIDPVTSEASTQTPVSGIASPAGVVELPGGKGFTMRLFDGHTGRLRQVLKGTDYHRVADAKNEIAVTGPELRQLMPGGLVAIITADTGRIVGERLEQERAEPRRGTLDGNVRIVVARTTASDAARAVTEDDIPSAEPSKELVGITMDRLDFDLEIGQLRTDGRVDVRSTDYEVSGTGLHLIWNQRANRLETLTLARGERLVLRSMGDLLGFRPRTAGDLAPPAPDTPPPPRTRRRTRPAPANAYACQLDGAVRAEQYDDQARVGQVAADTVELLFDFGSSAERLAGRSKDDVDQTPHERDSRLEITWNGKLAMQPVDPPADDAPPRRRFEARGAPVVLSRVTDDGDVAMRCGRIAYHDDTGRMWIDAVPGERVEISLGQGLSALAQAVYMEPLEAGAIPGRLIKLVGNVELRSQRGDDGPRGRLSSIQCAYWAELEVVESPDDAARDVTATLRAGRLRRATFVGDVAVDLGRQRLDAHRLELTFLDRPDTGSLEALLDQAAASGGVQLGADDGRITCAELLIVFDRTDTQALYPRRMDAYGAVRIVRGRATLTGEKVAASLAPPPDDTPNAPAFVLRHLVVTGKAELIEPQHRYAARGHEIVAHFEGLNELAAAMVTSAHDDLALVYAEPLGVRGRKIDMDARGLTLTVDGPSRVAFKTQRSLQGTVRGTPQRVVVESRDRLHIDGRGNRAHFLGDVQARTHGETLRGDELILHLEDVPADLAESPPDPLRALWGQVRGLIERDGARDADDAGYVLRLGDETGAVRKEPVQLTAINALVTSESFEQGSDEPVLYADLSAPRLDVDIVNRQITTAGVTQLLMTDRRGVAADGPVGDGAGDLTSLITRGPSQTAMQCTGGMVYTLGPDGSMRRDTAIFRDGVQFVHLAGHAWQDLQDMLAQLGDSSQPLQTPRGRFAELRCERLEGWFVAASGDRASRQGGALTSGALQLAVLYAFDDVFLRDQQGPRLREVNAAAIEFNREQSRVVVEGSDRADARVYFGYTDANVFDIHSGRKLLVDLRTGTIRTEDLTGELRRR